MRRPWFWVQLIIGWLPVWALYATIIVVMHPPATPAKAAFIAFRDILPAIALGFAVGALVKRYPWPRPMRLGFIGMHVVAAPTFALAWLLVSSAVDSALHGSLRISVGPAVPPFLILGVWLYLMVAGVSYASSSTERAAKAEASAARAQLSALRAQLHPHFLFNALHTIVHLIPREPERAADAAVEVAGLLRATLEEDRDIVSLADELAFVDRYLAIEHIRFGDRLIVHREIPSETRSALVPSFAVQTLVENAVRHGAAPQVGTTTIRIASHMESDRLRLEVVDDGAGASPDTLRVSSGGTGLARLRERIAVLYGPGASLELRAETSGPARGVRATLSLPPLAEHA